jgi:uridylate kinase
MAQPGADGPLPSGRRVLLKLSGDCFGRGPQGGLDPESCGPIAEEVAEAARRGVQIAVVVGGGNLIRGARLARSSPLLRPTTADYMGMLATVVNALALQDAIETHGIETRVLTAIRMEEVAEPYIRRRAARHLEKGRVVILAAGIGSPCVTTDTAAALRARELEAQVLLKATRVDGVYSDDPEKNPHAVRYEQLSYEQVLHQRLTVMDATAVSMCMEHDIPIVVFSFRKPGNILAALLGKPLGTLVTRASAAASPRTEGLGAS